MSVRKHRKIGGRYHWSNCLLFDYEFLLRWMTAGYSSLTEMPRTPFALPATNELLVRLFAYLLRTRLLDYEVVSAFAKENLIYESLELSKDKTRQFHNAIFVGYDPEGKARHAHKKGIYTMGKSYRGNLESSDPRYSFHHIGTDGSLYVFEAPIDMLSYITLHPKDWKSHSYVACCGTSFIPVQKILERMPQVETVYLCLDNDKAGHAASVRMVQNLKEMNIPSERINSEQKDWNEDLVAKYEKKEEIGICQVCGY